MKIGSQNRTVQEIGVKSQCLTQEKETTFGSSYREVQKSHSSRNQDSTALLVISLGKDSHIKRMKVLVRALLKLFSLLKGTNSKTTHYLMSYFLASTILNNTGKSSCCGPFDAEYVSLFKLKEAMRI